MKLLAVSDEEASLIYSAQIAARFRGMGMVVSCGDLPSSYLDYIASMLSVPLYYVHGNHVHMNDDSSPGYGCNLHLRSVRDPASGLLLAGLEGSLQYNFGPHQYSQTQMWFSAWELGLRLLANRLRYGRALDVLVTHAPPWGIHDAEDRPHQGIKAFNWLIRSFRPQAHLHGHIHLYRRDAVRETPCGATRVINVFGYKVIELDASSSR